MAVRLCIWYNRQKKEAIIAMKKARSQQEQTIALTRVAAAVRLGSHRNQVHADKKQYNRKKSKRLWQKDQEALFLCPYLPQSPVSSARVSWTAASQTAIISQSGRS